MRIRFLRHAVLLLTLAVAACAHLPEYAKPRRIQVDDMKKVIAAGFTYRQLKPEDFRATSLPKDLSTHGKNINAQAMTTIRLTSDSKFSILPSPFWQPVSYSGRINYIAFEAVMIPSHSWWNPNMQLGMKNYVLQHEQIHFALTELAARKLTRDARKWASDLSVVKQTPQEVYAEIGRQLKAMINAAMEANQKRQLKFDEDTSFSYNPTWQAWWLEAVEKELRQTEPDSGARER